MSTFDNYTTHFMIIEDGSDLSCSQYFFPESPEFHETLKADYVKSVLSSYLKEAASHCKYMSFLVLR